MKSGFYTTGDNQLKWLDQEETPKHFPASSGHFAEERPGKRTAAETLGEERRAGGGGGRTEHELSSIAGISRGNGIAGEGDRRAAPRRAVRPFPPPAP